MPKKPAAKKSAQKRPSKKSAITKKVERTPPAPFIVDMRHDRMSSPTFGVATKWEDALQLAGDFWEAYEGLFDPKAKQPFSAGEGYDDADLEVSVLKGMYLRLDFAGGQGPYIRIQRADYTRL